MADFFKNVWSALGDREFYLKDFRNAYHYTPSQDPPRQQFGGFVSFVLDRDLFNTFYNDNGSDEELRIRMSSLVRTADFPQIEFKTQTLNEYNRKKIINTGVEYQPVTIRVVDTASNAWLTIIMKYFAYHYMNPRNQGNQGERDLQNISNTTGAEMISSQFGAGGPFDSNKAGYNINYNPHFFERIDYVLYHANKGTQYSLMNPVMTGFTHTPIDYASNELMEFTMTFQYESFTTYDQLNFQLDSTDLARFEDVSSLSGSNDLFRDDGTKSIAASTQRDLFVLGDKNDPRPRSSQQNLIDGPDDFVTVKPTTTTYSTQQPASGSTNFFQNLFGERIGDVVDKSIAAAINGADVKDVALGAIFDNVAGEISDNNDPQQNLPPQERPPKPPPPEENQDEQTENGNNTPGDT